MTLRKTSAEAKSAWKDEERQGAFFGNGDSEEDRGPHMLNRSFSGTY